MPHIGNVIILAENMARYIVKENIATLVLLDRSARQAYIPLRYALQANHPLVEKPKVYFINPDGCETRTKDDNASQLLQRVHPYLSARKELPLLIFDTCCHTGSTMSSVGKFLKCVGFKKIHVGFGYDWRMGDGWDPSGQCLPFDLNGHGNHRDMIVTRSNGELISKREKSIERESSIKNRQKLHKGLRRHYDLA